MKNTILIICLSLFALSACNSSNDKDKSASNEPVVVVMGVEGMTCNGCVGTVEASVTQIGEGINSVKASLEGKTATIEYIPSKVDTGEITKAIELNGYKVTGVKETKSATTDSSSE